MVSTPGDHDIAEKASDIQTLAPRLSYVEDLAEWLKDNRGEGGGTTDEMLWKSRADRSRGLSDLGRRAVDGYGPHLRPRQPERIVYAPAAARSTAHPWFLFDEVTYGQG